MGKNLSRRERKKRETRQRLMDAALRLFCERGYDASTVREITEAADVAKSTFFNYFEKKEAILPALAEQQLLKIEEALSLEHEAPASPVARIKLALCMVAEDPLTDPLLVRRLFTALMQRRQQQDVHPGRALTYLLSKQVHQAQEVGEVRADLDPSYVGNMICAIFFQQMMVWYCGRRSIPLPVLLSRMIDLLLDGLAGPEWKKSA
jgi:AcrR family transcriptional regulator